MMRQEFTMVCDRCRLACPAVSTVSPRDCVAVAGGRGWARVADRPGFRSDLCPACLAATGRHSAAANLTERAASMQASLFDAAAAGL